jgi:6-phosphogluconolactonase/glucosamine-6-phosphate isomerase/deaminase
MTLTLPPLLAARRILWLITGADKREPLELVLARDPSVPGGRVNNPDAVVLADPAAAGGSTGSAR